MSSISRTDGVCSTVRVQAKKKNALSSGFTPANASHKNAHSVKMDKDKLHSKVQPTAQQIRLAQITDIYASPEDPKMSEKVSNLMETTQRSEEEVCCALAECDNDLDRAVIFLLETLPVGAFETSKKKKKTAVIANIDQNHTSDNWSNVSGKKDARPSTHSNRNGRGVSEMQGFRDRELKMNFHRNNYKTVGNDRAYDRYENKDSSGVRNCAMGRGLNQNRNGATSLGRADNSSLASADTHKNTEEESWNNTCDSNLSTILASKDITGPSIDSWGDWDNEEYTGSLSDTKVFTPSATNSTQTESVPSLTKITNNHLNDTNKHSNCTTEEVTADSRCLSVHETSVSGEVKDNVFVSKKSSAKINDAPGIIIQSELALATKANNIDLSPKKSILVNNNNAQNSISSFNGSVDQSDPEINISNTMKCALYNSSHVRSSRKHNRARVPPPSKIPSMAVEMPGDVNDYLDVQFGAMDFGSEDTFNLNTNDKSNLLSQDTIIMQSPEISAIDISSKIEAAIVPVSKQSQKNTGLNSFHQPSNIKALGTTIIQQSIINPASDNLSSSVFSQLSSSSNQQQLVGSSVLNNVIGIDELSADYDISTPTSYQTSQTFNSDDTQKRQVEKSVHCEINKSLSSSGYTTSNVFLQNYTNSNYVNEQTSNIPANNISGGTYSSNAYNSYNHTEYQQDQDRISNINISQTQNISTSDPTSLSSTVYMANQYSNCPTSLAYSSQPQQQHSNVYQNSYGSGINVSSGTSGQYSNFSTQKVNESSPVTTVYDSVSCSVGSNQIFNNSTPVIAVVPTTTSLASIENHSSNVPSAIGSINSVNNSSPINSTLSSTVVGLNNNAGNVIPGSKSSTNASVVGSVSGPSSTNSASTIAGSGLTSNGSGNVVSNIPMVSQYIPTGMPFYQQPVYSYEEIQLMQQRMPPLPTGYYDINYTPTSISTGVREQTLGSVAYSTISDGRFGRNDNSSPVNSTISQQSNSSGPMLNLPFAYFYGGNMMPGGFQAYGTPAIYPQQMTAANAASGAQFQKPAYNSVYGNAGYDSLNQSNQEYSKGPYSTSAINQTSKNQSVGNPPLGTGNNSTDLSTSMYGKNHVSLNKSYDKQSFNSGTPPPFNLSGSTTTSGQGYNPQQLYITHAMPTGHHSAGMHQTLQQDSTSTSQRQQSNNQGKSGAKTGYSPSYWTSQN